MNTADSEYFKLVDFVFKEGKVKENRTNTKTLGAFGAQARFDLSQGFPILITKKVFFRSVVYELLWFLSGSTNIKDLLKNEVHIWDEWAYKKYVDNFGNIEPTGNQPPGSVPMTSLAFTERITGDASFAAKWGDLGEGTYGGMWRAFPTYDPFVPIDDTPCSYVDQITKLIERLKRNPTSRRHIVSAWHPYWVDHCALPPCHVLFQFHTEELCLKDRTASFIASQKNSVDKMMALRKLEILGDNPASQEAWNDFLTKAGAPLYKLNLQLYQRSADLFLGVPFNISSYSLLLAMVAQVVNMVPGVFVHSFGDIHIYENHMDQLKIQSERKPYKQPKLHLNPQITNIFGFRPEDITLIDYKFHPAIKGEVAV